MGFPGAPKISSDSADGRAIGKRTFNDLSSQVKAVLGNVIKFVCVLSCHKETVNGRKVWRRWMVSFGRFSLALSEFSVEG